MGSESYEKPAGPNRSMPALDIHDAADGSPQRSGTGNWSLKMENKVPVAMMSKERY